MRRTVAKPVLKGRAGLRWVRVEPSGCKFPNSIGPRGVGFPTAAGACKQTHRHIC